MNGPNRKLQHEHKSAETHQVTSAQQQQAAREFSSAEEMLRCDAEQIVVPPHLAARLRKSISQEPRPQRNWWQRWFGR
jgi:hypothetical protein